MVDWLNGFIIPIVECIFIGGIVLFILFYVGKAFNNAWSKNTKFFLKYKILKKEIPSDIKEWCFKCIDRGIGYYDAKKLLYVNMIEQNKINETLYIYDQILIELEGGKDKNGRKFERSNSKIEGATKLPKF